MRHSRLLVPLLLALLVVACGGDPDPSGFTRLGPQAFHAAVVAGDAVLIDLRTPEEVTTGAIAGAVVLDAYAPDFDTDLAALDRTTAYLVYCETGTRSAATVRTMKDLGFRRVTQLDGGIQAWITAGFPTSTTR